MQQMKGVSLDFLSHVIVAIHNTWKFKETAISLGLSVPRYTLHSQGKGSLGHAIVHCGNADDVRQPLVPECPHNLY